LPAKRPFFTFRPVRYKYVADVLREPTAQKSNETELPANNAVVFPTFPECYNRTCWRHDFGKSFSWRGHVDATVHDRENVKNTKQRPNTVPRFVRLQIRRRYECFFGITARSRRRKEGKAVRTSVRSETYYYRDRKVIRKESIYRYSRPSSGEHAWNTWVRWPCMYYDDIGSDEVKRLRDKTRLNACTYVYFNFALCPVPKPNVNPTYW